MPDAPVQIRLATPADAADFVAVVQRAFEETRAYELPSSALNESVEHVRQALEAGAGLIATSRGVVVGCVRVAISGAGANLLDVDLASGPLPQPRCGVRVSFSRLGVVPEARDQGVATAMLDLLSDYARAIGAEAIELTARSQQPDNRPKWIRRGYRVTHYSECYGISDMVTHMQCQLNYDAEGANAAEGTPGESCSGG